MSRYDPEKTIRSVLDACADCDTCRYLMDESCLLFPELYRLYDRESQDGVPVREADLQKLAQSCTFCGLCPCPNIRADVIRHATYKTYHSSGSWGAVDGAAAGKLPRLSEKQLFHTMGAAEYHAPIAPMMKGIDTP